MIDESVRSDLLDHVDQLPLGLQQQVLQYAKDLVATSHVAGAGRDFLALAGILSPEDAKEMMEAVEEGCERIDPNDW